MAAGRANGRKRSRTAGFNWNVAAPTRIGIRCPPAHLPPPPHISSHPHTPAPPPFPPSRASTLPASTPPQPAPPRSADEMWDDCYALVEELELRGEVTEAEGAVLRQFAEDRYAPLGTLFKARPRGGWCGGVSLGERRKGAPGRAAAAA